MGSYLCFSTWGYREQQEREKELNSGKVGGLVKRVYFLFL